MNILIEHIENSEPEMLAACIKKCQQYMPEDKYEALDVQHTIHCNPRTNSGWLEYGIIVRFPHGKVMIMGAIRRTVGAEVEFHS